jgi:hypothetical protein
MVMRRGKGKEGSKIRRRMGMDTLVHQASNM